MSRKKWIDVAEFIAVVGVEERTVKDWRAAGMPFKKGRPCLYCLGDCYRWLAATRKYDAAAAVEKAIEKENAGKRRYVRADRIEKPVVVVDPVDDKPPLVPCEPASFNIHENKKLVAEILIEAANAFRHLSAIEKAAASATIKSLSDTFRKIEGDCITIDRQLGTLIPTSEAKKYIAEIFNRVRTDLRSIPFSLAKELAAVTNTDPELIVEILKPKIDDALRHLAEEIIRDSRHVASSDDVSAQSPDAKS